MADLPKLGLAAKIIKSDFCSPAKILSKARKPVGIPLNPPLCLLSSSILLKVSSKVSLTGVKVWVSDFWAMLKTFFSAWSNRISTSSDS